MSLLAQEAEIHASPEQLGKEIGIIIIAYGDKPMRIADAAYRLEQGRLIRLDCSKEPARWRVQHTFGR